MDESGFEDNQDCIYAWSKKGKKVDGEQEGKRGIVVSLGELRQVFLAMKVFQWKKNISFLFKMTIKEKI